MNTRFARLIFTFRIILALALIFLINFNIPARAQDLCSTDKPGKNKSSSSGTLQNNKAEDALFGKKRKPEKENPEDFYRESPLLSWLLRQPVGQIWTETKEYSLKLQPQTKDSNTLNRQKTGIFKHDKKNEDKFRFTDEKQSITHLKSGGDLFEDTVKPETTGRSRRFGSTFNAYDPSQPGYRSNLTFKNKNPGTPDYIKFDNKLSKMEMESGNNKFLTGSSDLPHPKDEQQYKISNNFDIDNPDINVPRKPNGEAENETQKLSIRREPFGHPRRKKKPEKKKLKFKKEEGPFRLKIKGDEVRYYRGVVSVDGNSTVEYRGLTLKADKLKYNRYSKEIIAEGNVCFSRQGDKLTGSYLKYDPVTQDAVIQDAYGHAEDITVGDVDLQQTIFFWGKEVRWKNGVIQIKKGTATTCDVAPPDYHYHITGDEIVIIPREKMIVRKARFFKGKSQWFGLPSAVFPLRQRDPRRRQSYIPQIGNNRQEGFYVKENVGYLWGKKDYGVVHVDWYEKVGIGGGLEHWYHLGDRGAGKVYYYQMGSSTNPTNRYNFSNRIYYKFPNNVFTSLNYTTERYESPEYSSPDIRNADFYLSHFNDKTRSALRVRDYISGDDRNYGINLLNRYNFSDRLYSQVVVDFLSTETTLRRLYRLNTLGRLVYRGDVFDSTLTYDRTSGSRKFYVNREPEVMLRSAPQKLGPFDYRVSLAAGNFLEMPSEVSAARGDLRLSLLNKIYPVTSSTDFSVAGGLRQLIYGTGEKKYIVRALSNLEQRIGKNFSVIATHYFQEKDGYSPLALDYFENYNILGGTLEYFNHKNLRMQLTGGYDLNHKIYQSMIPRLEYLPSKDWRFVFSSNYDVDRKEWMNLDGELGLKLTNTTTIKYWGLYDFINQKMTYQNYVLEFDSHDFATRLIYKGSQGEIWLSLALKAFPYEKIEVGPNEDRNIVEKGLLERAPDEEGL